MAATLDAVVWPLQTEIALDPTEQYTLQNLRNRQATHNEDQDTYWDFLGYASTSQISAYEFDKRLQEWEVEEELESLKSDWTQTSRGSHVDFSPNEHLPLQEGMCIDSLHVKRLSKRDRTLSW